MPKIPDRQTVDVNLPGIEGGVVTIYTALLAADIERLTTRQASGQASDLFMLTLVIKGWNLTDDNDQPLEVNETNVGKLTLQDLKAINDATEKAFKDFLETAKSVAGTK